MRCRKNLVGPSDGGRVALRPSENPALEFALCIIFGGWPHLLDDSMNPGWPILARLLRKGGKHEPKHRETLRFRSNETSGLEQKSPPFQTTQGWATRVRASLKGFGQPRSACTVAS